MFCKNCGKEIKDDMKFCVYCGAKLSETVQEEAAPARTQQDMAEGSCGSFRTLACGNVFCPSIGKDGQDQRGTQGRL